MTDTRPQDMVPRAKAQELFYRLEKQACAVSVLGELLQAADPERLSESVPRDLGGLLWVISSEMFDTTNAGLDACRPPAPVSGHTT